jgi:hypothetical protein
MKHCPVCKTAYTDDSLRYCLADGAALTSEIEEPSLARKLDPVPFGFPGADTKVPKRPIAGWQKGLIAFLIIGAVFAAAVILMAGVLYMNTGGKATNVATPVPSSTPTTDPDKQRLQDELANLQRKIDEQKNSNRLSQPTTNSNPFPNQTQPGSATARVNSPNDGFLALRNIPDATGGRLAKIPHNSTVALNNCEKNKVTVGGRSGRWCQVEYAGQTGWVFDAWLVY